MVEKVMKVITPKESPAEKARRTAQEKKVRSQIQSFTIQQLIDSLYKFRRKGEIKKTGRTEIVDVKLSNTKTRYLIVHAQTQGTKLWQQILHFPTVQASETPKAGYEIPIRDNHGNVYYMPKLTGATPVLVRCSCPDFRHSFMWEDFDVKSLSGRRLSYERKTTTRPKRNPDHIPGVCKHLMGVINKLVSIGVMTEVKNTVDVNMSGYLWSNK